MKRSVPPLLFLCLVMTFASCSGKLLRKDPEPARTFTVRFSASRADSVFEGELSCYDRNDIRIAFTAPAPLEGFSVKTDGERYLVDAYGVPDCFRFEEAGTDSLLNVLISSLRAAVYTNGGTFVRDRETGGFHAEITVENVTVTVCFGENGIPVSLEAPGIGLSVRFLC